MSRYYQMDITVRDVKNQEAVKLAIQTEWAIDDWSIADWSIADAEICATGTGNLCGGESEDEFARRLVRAVWLANGGFCPVEVIATYLENLPYESYVFEEEDYNNLMGEK